MLWTKIILIILNTLVLIGALLTLIRYVRKTVEIAELSEESAEDIEKTNAVSREAVELSEKTLLEMRETRRMITAPLVVVYFERGEEDEHTSHLFFIVENVGGGVARNIAYNFSPTLKGNDAESVERIIRLGENIDSLPANYRMVNLFGRVGDYLDLEFKDVEDINTELPRRFDVAVTFEDAVNGDFYSENYSLDLGVPLGTCAR